MSTRSKVFLAVFFVTPVLAAVALAAFSEPSRSDASATTPPPTPAEPPQTPQEIRGVVLYKSRMGFLVCTRQPLHQCRARWGYENLGRGTFRFLPYDINPARSCETITSDATSTCLPDGSVLDLIGANAETLACLARNGFIYRGSDINMERIDPREEEQQLAPGVLRIDCAEGYRAAQFDEVR